MCNRLEAVVSAVSIFDVSVEAPQSLEAQSLPALEFETCSPFGSGHARSTWPVQQTAHSSRGSPV